MRPLLFWLLTLPATAFGEGWAVNVYGLSYHPDREAARAAEVDNEFNPGLALRYEWSNGVYSEFGVYRDSGGTAAKFANVGYQWRFSNFRIGAALAIAQSHTYHDGQAFIAPIPVVSYDFGRVMVNAVYFHKVRGMNEIAAFGAYLTIPLEK
jgi:hypothetical protein